MKKYILIVIFLIVVRDATGTLIAHWKMNDNAASATVVDALGVYNGTYTDKDGNINTDTGESTGKICGALDFDGQQRDGGTDEYVDTGDPFQSLFQDSFSISMWVKPTDGKPPHTGYFLGVATVLEGNMVKMVITNGGTITFQYNSNGQHARLYANAATPYFSDGQETWHHLVMVADSTINDVGGIKAYLDGSLSALHSSLSRGDTNGVVFADYASTLNVFIGGENYLDQGGTNFYNGLIDNVMIYDTALTPDEAKRLYNNNNGTEIPSEVDSVIRPRRTNTSPLATRARFEFR